MSRISKFSSYHIPFLFSSLYNHLAISYHIPSFLYTNLISKHHRIPTTTPKAQPSGMGCASSRPANPGPKPRSRQNIQRQTVKPQSNSRLSRPFDPNVPLYDARQSARPSAPRAKARVPPVPAVDPARYQDAFAQLNARSKQKPRAGQKTVDPARYGDAYAQLNGKSKQNRAQAPRKDQKVQFAQGKKVKSQAAVQGFRGDTLYFSCQP